MSEYKLSALHLIVDEPVEVQRKFRTIACRMRIWQGRGTADVVLCSAIPGRRGVPADATTKFADIAYHWGPPPMSVGQNGLYYFESSIGRVWRVDFDLSTSQRIMRFAAPRYSESVVEAIEMLVGTTVEL